MWMFGQMAKLRETELIQLSWTAQHLLALQTHTVDFISIFAEPNFWRSVLTFSFWGCRGRRLKEMHKGRSKIWKRNGSETNIRQGGCKFRGTQDKQLVAALVLPGTVVARFQQMWGQTGKEPERQKVKQNAEKARFAKCVVKEESFKVWKCNCGECLKPLSQSR